MKVNPIIRFAVERRVTMAMAVLGVLVLGWLSLDRLPLEFLPTFSSSHISVDAPYPSSSPAETERLIVRPLEDSLSTINGIESLTAVSTASSGNVSIRFVDGTDMDLAAVDVRDRAGRVRLRPILMTTATTVFGLLPMALGLGEGSELRTPMALTVIGGMITSTLLTLLVVPAVYAILDRRS